MNREISHKIGDDFDEENKSDHNELDDSLVYSTISSTTSIATDDTMEALFLFSCPYRVKSSLFSISQNLTTLPDQTYSLSFISIPHLLRIRSMRGFNLCEMSKGDLPDGFRHHQYGNYRTINRENSSNSLYDGYEEKKRSLSGTNVNNNNIRRGRSFSMKSNSSSHYSNQTLTLILQRKTGIGASIITTLRAHSFNFLTKGMYSITSACEISIICERNGFIVTNKTGIREFIQKIRDEDIALQHFIISINEYGKLPSNKRKKKRRVIGGNNNISSSTTNNYYGNQSSGDMFYDPIRRRRR